MKIALLAPPYLPVPPPGYGGTERIVNQLTEGLVKRGHDVTLFAAGDSTTSAKLVPIVPKALGNTGTLKDHALIPMAAYTECFSRADEFEVIHNHAQYYGVILADLVKTPVVHTLHGTIAEGEVPEEKRRTLRQFADHHFVSISNDQRRGIPELNWVATVYNGTPVETYPFVEDPNRVLEKDQLPPTPSLARRGRYSGYLLWFGRITPKKGLIESIQAARKVGLPLKIAGVVDPIDQEFFERDVQPLLSGPDITLIGEVTKEKKMELYGHALATMYPISWHEPFGLVMTESMACGTPVVAYRRGSVPEIVADGETGYVVDPTKGIDGLADALQSLISLSSETYKKMRRDSRKWVEDRFAVERMVGGYEEVYKKVVGR